MASRNIRPAQPLTRREIEVLQLLRGPLPRREIAAELRLSLHTVKSHTRIIYRKLGVSTRRDAISREAPPLVRPDRRTSAAEPLTEREIEVLQLLRGPWPRCEIAAELGLSLNTVKSHIRAIFRKLGVSTRHAAIARGQAVGIWPAAARPRRATSPITRQLTGRVGPA
jgi:ATP/maltotriose-dependent transcriptional regulator MalT